MLSRLWCKVFGHDWTEGSRGVVVCQRTACRGREDATRLVWP